LAYLFKQSITERFFSKILLLSVNWTVRQVMYSLSEVSW